MMGSNACYSAYLVGQQLMLTTALSGGRKMDSISNLYFLGPATAVGLAVVAACTEWTQPDFNVFGANPWLLLADGALAFSLNLIQIKILGRLSALTYMFAGYLKGVITVGISVVFRGEGADGLEFLGYAVMLWGQLLWSLRKMRGRDPPPAGPDPGLRMKGYLAGGFFALVLLASLAVSGCVLLPCQSGR